MVWKSNLPTLGTILLSLFSIALLTTAGGIWLLRGFLLQSEASHRNRLSTRAEVLEVKISPAPKDSIEVRPRDPREPSRYIVSLRYRYQPQGLAKALEGGGRLSDGEYDSKDAARESIPPNLKRGAKVPVYYHPEHPERSSPLPPPGPTNTGRIMTQGFLVVLAAGLGSLLPLAWWRRFWKAHEPAPNSDALAFGAICLAVLGSPFAFAGALVLLLGLQTYWVKLQLGEWRQTEGTILSTSIESRTSSAKGAKTRYLPQVTYSYSLPGGEELLQGDKVRAGALDFTYKSRAEAEDFCKRHPVGSKAAVFYDPDNPSSSALERDVAGGGWIAILLGSFTAGLGTLLLAGAVRLLKRVAIPRA